MKWKVLVLFLIWTHGSCFYPKVFKTDLSSMASSDFVPSWDTYKVDIAIDYVATCKNAITLHLNGRRMSEIISLPDEEQYVLYTSDWYSDTLSLQLMDDSCTPVESQVSIQFWH